MLLSIVGVIGRPRNTFDIAPEATSLRVILKLTIGSLQGGQKK